MKTVLKEPKRELRYLFYPRWKLIDKEISSINLSKIKGKNKKEILELKYNIDIHLRKNRKLGMVIFAIYILIYFSVISIVLSFLDIITYFSGIISQLVNTIGTPILILIVFFLNRIIVNRYQELNMLISKFYSKLEK